MKTCKFCGLSVLSGNVVHTDCAEAAIEAVALTNEERQELEAYRETGTTPEVIWHLQFAILKRGLTEITEFCGVSIERLKELAKADTEGRLVVFTEVPECLKSANE